MRTLSDLTDRLRAYIGNDPDSLKSSACYRAAVQAVQGIASRHEWNYYTTMGRVDTSAPYRTGTIEYDATGGAYERMVTLTGGTLPTWVAGYGTLVINAVPYDIDQRISNTVCTLKSNSAPTADVAAGQAYTIYRARYDLPIDFQSIHKPILTSFSTRLEKMSISDFVYRRNLNDGVAQPYMFTTIDNGYGLTQILFWNPPDQVYQFEFEYKRKPPLPAVDLYSTGRISLTAGSKAVTGVSTAWVGAMCGAVLRVSYNQDLPTAPDGLNPPQYEYVIDQSPFGFTSSTALNLLVAATETAANRAYTISSRVDVEEGPMFDFLVQIGMKNMRIALRMNAIDEERPDYGQAEKLAKSWDGQKYGDSDTANACIAQIGKLRGSYLRNV
jgi:hypothetical protein